MVIQNFINTLTKFFVKIKRFTLECFPALRDKFWTKTCDIPHFRKNNVNIALRALWTAQTVPGFYAVHLRII